MRCPVCGTYEPYLKEHLVQPVRYGGLNAVDYYSCLKCGVMFKETENNKKEHQAQRDSVSCA